MDRLRINMHALLKQGGEEAMLLQMQNSQFNKELDGVRESYESEKLIRQSLELENIKIKIELQRKIDNEKLHIDELNAARENNFKLNCKFQALRTELAQVTASVTVIDSDNIKLRSLLTEEVRDKEIRLERKAEELKHEKLKWERLNVNLDVQLTAKTSELAAMKSQLEEKWAFIQKLEHAIISDAARFEKKLALQVINL
jgi:hypothetical protein